MIALPKKVEMPQTITLEKRASHLASLAITDKLRQMQSIVVSQWRNRDTVARLAKHGVYPIRQLLFYGPPGNGKTSGAQWLAAQMDVPLYRVRAEMIVGSYLGSTAKTMRDTLDWLETVGEAVVLFDEIETLFESRELPGSTTSQERHSAMATLWQSLDRWTTPQVFVFATNMIAKLDPAMQSRFEMRFEFLPPTASECRSVIEYWAEVFHEFGSSEWAPKLIETPFYSFRHVWQEIAAAVRANALEVPNAAD